MTPDCALRACRCERSFEYLAVRVARCRASIVRPPGLPVMPIIFVTAHGEIDEFRKKKCVNEVPRIIFKKPFDGG
jgi:hypothetical protein